MLQKRLKQEERKNFPGGDNAACFLKKKSWVFYREGGHEKGPIKGDPLPWSVGVQQGVAEEGETT